MDPKQNRELLKGYEKVVLDKFQSDQMLKIEQPPVQKPAPETGFRVDLIPADKLNMDTPPLLDMLLQRRSRRKYTDESMTLEELSYLVFVTYGVQKVIRNKAGVPVATLRPYASGGARHPFETYLYINRVEGVKPGMYRYLGLEHQLVFMYNSKDLPGKITEACCGQAFVGAGAVVFIWTAVPYRTEWRYHGYAAKFVAQDSGHLCENLYLAAESIGCGTCGIGAYMRDLADALVQVDGEDEMVIYIAPVGRIRQIKPFEVSREQLEKYAGTYLAENEKDSAAQISVKDGGLVFEEPGQVTFTLIPVAGNLFKIAENTDLEITFQVENDTVTGFKLDQFGQIIPWRRK